MVFSQHLAIFKTNSPYEIYNVLNVNVLVIIFNKVSPRLDDFTVFVTMNVSRSQGTKCQ